MHSYLEAWGPCIIHTCSLQVVTKKDADKLWKPFRPRTTPLNCIIAATSQGIQFYTDLDLHKHDKKWQILSTF